MLPIKKRAQVVGEDVGHKHLVRLPTTHEWQQVVALLDGDFDLDEIASASAAAAERVLERASDDALLTHAVWLLSQIPQAARSDDFQERLGALGLNVGRDPSLLDIAGAFAQAMDGHARRLGGRSDLGEMAQHVAVEAITSLAGRELPTLFGATGSDVQKAIAGFGSPGRYSVLARDFFSRLTYRCLSYYLSRELSNHVGPGQRFANSREHSDFKDALARHCREASRIIKEFSSGWYSKTLFEQGGISEERARSFTYVAFKKIREELRRGREDE